MAKELSISYELTEKDFNLFIGLFEINISTYYPFSSDRTAKAIVEIHKKGIDLNGYFTKKKTIWKLIDEDNNVLGFSVATEKRGGSVKIGPTAIVYDFRRQGYGSKFKECLENYYKNKGYRKIYLTTNTKNEAVHSYLTKIGYKTELHLMKHYTTDSNEFVLSKFLNEKFISDNTIISDENIKKFGKNVVDYLVQYYDEIDNTFFVNLDNSISSNFDKDENSFISKKKLKFDFREDNFFAITSPKRGGCVKICPLILSGNNEKDKENILKIIKVFDSKQFHKFYTFIPIDCVNDRKLLVNCNFKVEGMFSSPYKDGIDMLMVSLIRD
jgi:RimJ/RimL family protein N-acetyltransferase